MTGAFDFKKDRSSDAAEIIHPRDRDPRRGRADAFKLHALLQTVAGHIASNFFHHPLKRTLDFIGMTVIGETENRVAHDQRGFDRVENDDGFAPRCAAHAFDSARRGLRKLVDIGAGAGAGGFARDTGDDLAVMHLATRFTAATMGMVACPPQLTIFRLGASKCWSMFTTGTTKGPTAAGVRSINCLPVPRNSALCWRWALAEVASKTMSISANRGIAIRP